VLVPDDDLACGNSSGKKSARNRSDDGGPSATQRAGFGKNLDADGCHWWRRGCARIGDSGGLREMCEAAIEGGFDAIVVGQKGVEQVFALHDDDAGGGIGGVE